MQHYPNNLRELRKAKGMLQIEVAQLLGHLNSDRISDWEKGYGMPSVANLFKLATVLGVPTEDIYREIRATATEEVEEKRVSLKNENEWVRRMKLKQTTDICIGRIFCGWRALARTTRLRRKLGRQN